MRMMPPRKARPMAVSVVTLLVAPTGEFEAGVGAISPGTTGAVVS